MQELGAFSGPENRTQRGCEEILMTEKQHYTMRSQTNYKIELIRNESGREITIILHIRKVIAAKG